MTVEAERPEDQRIELGTLLGAVMSRWLRILVVTAVALGLTYVVLLFVPRLYESTAALLVEQRNNAAGASAPQQQSPTIPADAMMSSQIELVKSRDTLTSVIDSENLRSEPEFTGVGFAPASFVMQLLGRGPEPRSIDETVLDNLNERLSVVRERDSAVISINVRSSDPDRAARIANAIAAGHVRRRTELSLSDTAEASVWLEQEISRLRVRVQEAEAAVANYRVENDLFTGTDNAPILDQQLTAISSQITAAQERRNAAESRANLIRQLTAAGQPLDGVQAVRDSAVIQQLSETKANLQAELAQRSSTLLPNHPTIKALVAQVAEIEQQITREARRVADALEAEAKIEGDLEQSLRDELARAKISVSTATRDNVTLEGLQREAKAQRDLLEAYLARYSDAASRTGAGSALPDVRQITFAAPSVTPAFPKTGMILGAVGFVALALQIGAALFAELMSGRAIVERPARARRNQSDEAAEFTEDDAMGDLFDAPEAQPRETLTVDERPAAPRQPQRTPPPPPRPAVAMAERAVPERAVPEPSEPIAPTPESPSTVAAAPRRREPARAPRDGDELGNLSADIAIGRVRVILLAALDNQRDCQAVADILGADAQRKGLSVVRIDAGSARASTEPGLTDLAADKASFGDVVHRVREGLAEVPWGHEPTLERRSMRPITLIEALTDIYEVVIIETGRIGVASSLPVFSGLRGRLVLVSAGNPDRDDVDAAIEDAAGFGFEVGQIVSKPPARTEVA